MPKTTMNDMLKRRMTATQQASELQTSDEAYQQIFREKVPFGAVQFCDLPLDKLVAFFTADISTAGDPAARGKAVALTLLEIAADSGRSFGLIHFAGTGEFKTDLFRPGEYTMRDKLSAAETFLNGGTDFQTPMEEALRLMETEGFENADIVFITDGECKLPQECLEELRQEQTARRFTVTGVLLDKGGPGMDFSLKEFCQDIYRTSELLGDDIVRSIVSKRV